jgi:hypothetical protein
VEAVKLRGEYVAPSTGRVTVGELGPAWLQRQRGHLKAASYRAYESAWDTNVAPRWQTVPIAVIHHSDVSGWLADLAARRGAETVRNAHKVLSAILNDAVRDRMLASNPARGVKLPKRPPQRHVYLSADQLARLWPTNQTGTAAWCCCWVSAGCGGAKRLRCECPTWIFCAVGWA